MWKAYRGPYCTYVLNELVLTTNCLRGWVQEMEAQEMEASLLEPAPVPTTKVPQAALPNVPAKQPVKQQVRSCASPAAATSAVGLAGYLPP